MYDYACYYDSTYVTVTLVLYPDIDFFKMNIASTGIMDTRTMMLHILYCRSTIVHYKNQNRNVIKKKIPIANSNKHEKNTVS